MHIPLRTEGISFYPLLRWEFVKRLRRYRTGVIWGPAFRSPFCMRYWECHSLSLLVHEFNPVLLTLPIPSIDFVFRRPAPRISLIASFCTNILNHFKDLEKRSAWGWHSTQSRLCERIRSHTPSTGCYRSHLRHVIASAGVPGVLKYPGSR